MKLPAAKRVLITAVLLLGACSKNIQTTEAVRAGVMDYLTAKASQTGLDMNAMQVDVARVSFERDEARATIAIRPKNIESAAPMQIAYVLDRKGDKWVVRGPGTVSDTPHGVAPPAAEDAPGSQALPPGHPSVGATPDSTGALPPGHPPVEKKQ